jgi:hypothetical protein
MALQERLVASITDIRTRGQRLAELHRELATVEMKEKGKKFGGAVGVFLGAGVLGLYAVGFVLATIAVLLALVLPLWAALLIVTGALFVVIAILVAVGRHLVEAAKTPAPETAVAEGKKTAELIKQNVRQTADGVRSRVKTGRAAPGRAPVTGAWAPATPGGAPPATPAGAPPAADAPPAAPAPATQAPETPTAEEAKSS